MSNSSNASGVYLAYNDTDRKETYEWLDDISELLPGGTRTIVYVCLVGFILLFGISLNGMALVILLRRRLWLKHELYFHHLAIFVSQLIVLTVVIFPDWVSEFRWNYHIVLTSDLACKFWTFSFAASYFSIFWLVAGMLLNVCLRWRQMQDGREGGYFKKLTLKFCTLPGAKVFVGAVAFALVSINLWILLYFRLQEYTYCGYERWHIIYHILEMVSWCSLMYFPVLFVIPVLLVMTFIARRKKPLDAPLDSASVMTDNVMKASMLIALCVFVLVLPKVGIWFLHHIGINTQPPIWLHYLIAICYDFRQLAIPLVWLTAITEIRQMMLSVLSGRLQFCVKINYSESMEEDSTVPGILPLETMENHLTPEA